MTEKKGVPLVNARGEVIGRVTEFILEGEPQPLTGHFEIVKQPVTDEQMEQGKQAFLEAFRMVAEGLTFTVDVRDED